MNEGDDPAEFLNSHRELLDVPLVEPDKESDLYDHSEQIVIILAIYVLVMTALVAIGWLIAHGYR
jgi:hypothetical protein